MSDWFSAPTAGASFSDDEDDVRAANAGGDGTAAGTGADTDASNLNAGSMLRFASVADVTGFFRGQELASVFTKLAQYGGDEAATKNAITKDDPEHEFLQECSKHVLTIEVEKSKVHKFIRDHYGVRFPELASLCSDSVVYAKIVKTIGNGVDDLTPHVEALRDLMPSQLVCAACACSATTAGRALAESELSTVLEACEEMVGLEDAKQLILHYIQTRTPLVCPNLSSFVGPAIASQLLAIAGSVTTLSTMDAQEIAALGSARGHASGFKIKSAGFLINVDLVACHPPELRQKALRMVAARAVTLARIDDNRRASDDTEGKRAREELKRRMLEWTDPLVQQVQSRLRGLSNKTYERRTRRRAVDKAQADRARRGVAKAMAGKAF
uniref:Nop domain-containing protein n=1 Tax=Neobodo designis TaxID=312471 RepID=A0A7S1Q872_NEODS|mmetsp:Transcript_33997/g.104952  ORF Transcript_33997/g.104952 Transcript_33997/m.104952 type:complete len:384 (+) Transcript_33997:54-1205(+)